MRVERKVRIEGEALGLLGPSDVNLQVIENRFESTIVVRGGVVTIRGDKREVESIEKVFKELQFLLSKNGTVTKNDVETVINLLGVQEESTNGGHRQDSGSRDDQAAVVLYTRNQIIRPKTSGQGEYIRAVAKNDIVFAIGPAGTGKTYLAVALAVAALKGNEISKIVLTRPAVEAGESLGFLPGDLKEKIDPYLRPLYDALDDMMAGEKLRAYLEKRIIEIAPLAYMRGRTLNNAFVILDEAQNASAMQMKMFLTRLGPNSRAIVTGDVTQIDLPTRSSSGLVQIQKVLSGIEGIAFVYLDRNDVVRHRLVKDIIDAYDKFHNGGDPAGESG
ncbi:MAG: PhoH family protein [Ignavibacteria bacterium]|nr:PhoH family protein [Ignavibacteria bacterium]